MKSNANIGFLHCNDCIKVYHYRFNGQEQDNEVSGDGNSYVFEYRVHDSRLGRFISVDPLANEYVWNSPFAFAENRPIDGIDLEGLEWMLPFFFSRTTPMLRPVVEHLVKPIEPASKPMEVTPPVEQLVKPVPQPKTTPQQHFNRGRMTEAEQLNKNGLKKNNQTIESEGTRTIPDALKEGGKKTVEIKDVAKQSLTRQLRAQEKFSNENGFKPELIINKGAKLTDPLIKSSFEIKYYTPAAVPADNTRVVPLLIGKPDPKPAPSPLPLGWT